MRTSWFLVGLGRLALRRLGDLRHDLFWNGILVWACSGSEA